MAFDRGPVEKALGDCAGEGRIYLEKIVQVVHDIPEPPPEALVEMLLGELQTVVDAIPHGPFREGDWQNLLPEGFKPFFRTARDVRRYLNAVPVTLRVIGGEVALVDVLAMELIRVFAPSAYAEMAASVPTLVGEASWLGEDRSRRDARDAPRIATILEAARPHETPVREILQRLFPTIGHHVGGARTTGGEQAARRELRVADGNVLRTYFERTLPQGVVSGVLVSAAVEALGDRDQLITLFSELDADMTEALIARLEDYEHQYDPAVVEPAIPVLLNQLPRLREGRTKGMFDFGAEMVVGRVILRLLKRVDDEGRRLEIVERCLPEITAFGGRMELIDTAGHRENVGHRLIPEGASDRLYRELAAEVAAADPTRLAEERSLIDLFVRMTQDDEQHGRGDVRRLCEDDRVFLRLLRSGLGERRAQTVGEYAVRARPSLPWELLQEWLGADVLERRVTEVAERADRGALDDRTRNALETAEKYAAGEWNNTDRDF